MFCVAAAAAMIAAAPAPPAPHAMVPAAAAFSLDAKADDFVDPEIFVAQSGGAAGPGPEGIVHAAGERPALMTDDPATPAVNAQGKPLGFTLATWFGARGVLAWDPSAKRPQVATAFTGLVPGGVYSLFVETFGAPANAFAPLDGRGTANTFTADTGGAGRLSVTAPGPLTHANAVVLVLHSDGSAHGAERGEPGVSAHAVLVYRVP